MSAPGHVVASPVAPKVSGARRKWIVGALVGGVAVACAAAGVVVYEKVHATASPFRTVVVQRADITERVTATGILQPVITSPVGAQVSGIVWKLHADYNASVKAGDLLVELDPALFLVAVSLATAQLAQANANLSSALATANGARSARDRILLLQGQALASSGDVDASQALLGQASGATQVGNAQIAQARAQLDRARLDLQHSIIRSPVDGTVISRNVDVGQAVAATLTAPTLFTIAQDLRHMQVHSAVDEADIGDVIAGQTASFTVDAFREQTFEAVVREVRNAPQTAQNVVTYDVVLDVDNLDGKLRPGMTANVLILIVQRNQVAAVPNEALRFRPATTLAASTLAASSAKAGNARAGAAVYTPLGNTAVRTAIKAGVTDGRMTEVDGIDLGREVIIDVNRDSAKPASGGGQGRGL